MVSFKPTFQREVIEQILPHLGLWPAPVHSPPVAGYPLPSAPQRVASRDQGVRGPRNHAVGARGHRGLPGPAPGRPSFPLTAISGAPDTPLHPREAASREPWHPEVGPAGAPPKSKFLSPPRHFRFEEVGLMNCFQGVSVVSAHAPPQEGSR